MTLKNSAEILQTPLELPCGAVIKNRLAKSPMSDSLCDGDGNPTEEQIRLYERWAEGGIGLSLIGEVQGTHHFPEKPGNLVLGKHSDTELLQSLSSRATINSAHLWPQIGHAGALSHLPISQPKGPSTLNLEGLKCAGMSIEEIRDLPAMYAKTALYAQLAGFSGVHIHAGHGFLLSQFLSPLFNYRDDGYGGSIEGRCRIILEIINEVRRIVGPTFPVGIRINSTDQLEGGLTENDALEAIKLLNQTSIDLIDISGGTYFPGAKSISEGTSSGPYFLNFAQRSKEFTKIPLMVTGGFKKQVEAIAAVKSGAADMVGVGRAMALNPKLADSWLGEDGKDPVFPKFESTIPGGVTAWYTMRLTALAKDCEDNFALDLPSAVEIYNERDKQRCITWRKQFPY